MTDQTKAPAARRRWPFIIGGIVVLVAVVLVGTPFLIKKLAQDWFLDQGLHQASIENVDFNPFTGDLQIHNLQTTLSDETVLRFTNAQLEGDWWPLARRQVKVNKVRLRDANIIIEQKSAENRAAGILLAEDQAAAQETEPSKPWLLGIGDLELRNTNVYVNLPQMQTHVFLESVTLNDLHGWTKDSPGRLLATGKVNEAPFTLEGNLQPFSAEKIFDIDLSLSDLQLADFSGFMPEGDKISDGSAEITVAGRLTVAEDQSVRWLQAGPVLVNDIQLTSAGLQIDGLNVDWSGEIVFDQAAQLVSWEGPLKLTTLAGSVKAVGDLALADLEWNGNGKLAFGDTPKPESKGKLKLSGLKASLTDGAELSLAQLSTAELNVTGIDTQSLTNLDVAGFNLKMGEISVGLKSAGAGEVKKNASSQTINGLKLSELQFADAQNQVGIGKASAQKIVNKDEGQQQVSGLNVNGVDYTDGTLKVVLDQVEVSGIQNSLDGQKLDSIALKSVKVHEDSHQLAAISTLSVATVDRTAEGHVNVKNIQSSGTQLLKNKNEKAALASLGRVQVDNVAFVPEELIAIGSVQLADLSAKLVLDEQGKLQGLADKADKPKESTSKPLRVKVRSITIAKGSELQFLDKSVEPDYKLDAVVETMQISDLDSSHPDKPGQLNLAMAINEHGKLKLDGAFAPLTNPPNMDLKGTLTALELLPASPYSEDVIGYQLRSGQIGADIAIKIHDGELEVQNDLKIAKLNVKKAPNVEDKLGVPLDTGLAMLRDKHGVIKLKLPITGRYDSPDFDVSDVINQALGKALQTAAATYLVYALQPYGSALAAYKLAGKIGNAVNLEPLGFNAGSETVAEGQSDYLEKLAKLLKDRPKLGLRFCGVATKADHLAMVKAAAKQPKAVENKPTAEPPITAEDKAKLQALAKQRGILVKNKLIRQYGLGADRLFECASDLDLTDEGKPRVEVGL